MNETVATPSLVFSLIHTAHALEGRMESALEEIGLSLAKFGVIDSLAQTAVPLTLGELAAKASCVRSNMTQLVDRLEADGLVRRIADVDDRRVTRAELTPEGSEKQRLGGEIIERVQAEALASLPDADQASLRWVLRRLG